MAIFRRSSSLVFHQPLNMLSFCAQVRSTPAHQFVDEGRSQSFESFRRTSSLKLRRCALASPRWPRSARSPVHWCSGALAGLIFLGCSHAVGAAESGPCLAGEVRRRTSPPGGVGGHLRAAGRCAAAARPRTRALTASSYAPLTRRGARFVSTGTTMRVAERAGGRGPTVRIPGVAAAAAAALAALAVARLEPREWRLGRAV